VDAPKNEKTSGAILEHLVIRRVRVQARDVVFLKGVIEASEGVAVVFAESGGDLTIATLPGRERELDQILLDLRAEMGALLDFT